MPPVPLPPSSIAFESPRRRHGIPALAGRASALLALAFLLGPAALALNARGNILIIAHRGNPTIFLENTLPGFESGAQIADAVKFDTHVSKDGELVIIHDDSIDRTTNSRGLVSALTLAELKSLRIKGSRDSDPLRIPTLDEALAHVPPGKTIIVERKGGPLAPFLAYFRKNNLVGRAYLESSDWDFLREAKRTEPAMLVLAYKEEPMTSKLLDAAAALGADAVVWRIDFIPEGLYPEPRRRGMKLFVFVVKDLTQAKKMARLKVDGMFVDDPSLFVKNRNSFSR